MKKKRKGGQGNENHISRTVADRKQATSTKPLAKKKVKGFDGQVSIIIRSYRHRLADTWGCSEKYLIDALVDRGILRDDSTKEISEEKSRHYQIKIPKSEKERTEIIIKSLEGNEK